MKIDKTKFKKPHFINLIRECINEISSGHPELKEQNTEEPQEPEDDAEEEGEEEQDFETNFTSPPNRESSIYTPRIIKLYIFALRNNVVMKDLLEFFELHPELKDDFEKAWSERNPMESSVMLDRFVRRLNITIDYERSNVGHFVHEREKMSRGYNIYPTLDQMQSGLDKLKLGKDILRRKTIKEVVINEINQYGGIQGVINKEGIPSKYHFVQCLVRRLPPNFPPQYPGSRVNDLWVTGYWRVTFQKDKKYGLPVKDAPFLLFFANVNTRGTALKYRENVRGILSQDPQPKTERLFDDL